MVWEGKNALLLVRLLCCTLLCHVNKSSEANSMYLQRCWASQSPPESNACSYAATQQLSLTLPVSPAFKILCTFSVGWLSCWVMRYTSRKLRHPWSGLAKWVPSSKFHRFETSNCSKNIWSTEQLWISYPEVLPIRLAPKSFKVRFILSIISSEDATVSGLCWVQGVRFHYHIGPFWH